MTGATANMLPDQKRLHLNHGPIDLVIQAFGPAASVEAAYVKATKRFQTILPELVSELDHLRQPVNSHLCFKGKIARHMHRAVNIDYAGLFTPMAAVAGAVADEVVSVIATDPKIQKAYVNNGGDIALHMKPGTKFAIAIAGQNDRIALTAEDKINGIATSGWRGRSFSLGIADDVTVLARNSACADAMATLIANAVDLPGSSKITRTPASKLSPDSDLGNRKVTTDVARLDRTEIQTALARGATQARAFLKRGLIRAARLNLQGEKCIIGSLNISQRQPSHAPG